jgi:hypothetical protein
MFWFYLTVAKRMFCIFVAADSNLFSALQIADELNLQKEVEGIHDRLAKIDDIRRNNWCTGTEGHVHSSRALVAVANVPVERTTNSIDDLLDQLHRNSPELTID